MKSTRIAAATTKKPPIKRLQQFAVFDIDGTLIRWQLYHAVADALVKLGFLDPKDYLPIRQARMDWKRRAGKESFRSYEFKLIRLYEKWLRQIEVDQFDRAAQEVFDEYKDQTYTFTRDLIANLKQKNYLLLAISNSQTEIVALIAKYYGFDDYAGAIYERSNNHFTGKATLHVHDQDLVLKAFIRKHRLSLKNSIAVGDSTSDIPLLAMVTHPMAFNPERQLYAEAKKRGWQIVIERKNVIYKLSQNNGTYVLV